MPAHLRRLTAPAPLLALGLLTLAPPATAAPQEADAPAGGAPAALIEVPAGDLTLTVPEAWAKQPLASRMRLAQFLVPAAEGANAPTELAVFGGFGGTDEANLRRWVDQFAAEGREVKLVQGDSREGSYKLIDVTGTWNAPVGPPMMGKTKPQPGTRMLAAIVQVEGQGNYFLKMPGPAETVTDEVAAQFRATFGATAEGEKPFELK